MKHSLTCKHAENKGEKRRVALILNSARFFITHRVALAQALAKRYEVHVICPPGDEVQAIEAMGFKVHCIPMSRQGKSLLKECKTFFSLLKLYRKINPFIVHHFTIKPVLYGSLAARFVRVPGRINAITGLGYIYSDNKWTSKLLRFFILRAYRFLLSSSNTSVIFQNPDDYSYFIEKKLIDASHAVLIKGSGADTEKFPLLPLNNQPVPVIVLPSRMLWEKGIGEFVSAAKIIHEKGKQATFILAGGLDLENPGGIPLAQLHAWEKLGHVTWIGLQHDMVALFRRSDIICLPSYYREGVPKVLIEAAACGRPIVTTNMPGCREIVKHDYNGVLVEPRSVEALVEGLLHLLDNPQSWQSMGERGRERVVQEFSIEHVIAQTNQVYDKLASCVE